MMPYTRASTRFRGAQEGTETLVIWYLVSSTSPRSVCDGDGELWSGSTWSWTPLTSRGSVTLASELTGQGRSATGRW